MIPTRFVLLLGGLLMISGARATAPLSADSIKAYLTVLTADSLEGRESGKPGQRKAAAYLSSLYDSWNVGIAPGGSRLQNHPLSIRSNKPFNVVAKAEQYLFYRDYYYISEYPDTALLTSETIFAGFGMTADHHPKKTDPFKKTITAGKALLISGEKSQHKNYRSLNELNAAGRLQQLQSCKPSLVFVAVDSLYKQIRELEADPAQVRSIRSLPFPVIFISTSAVAEIFDTTFFKWNKALNKCERSGNTSTEVLRVPVTVPLLRETDKLIGQNVFGYIEGSDLKEQVIVLSAHYDHLGIHDNKIHYGADDDASGTSAIMEMARIFSENVKQGNRPRRSILFMNTCGEEKGLTGSRFYVEHPFFPAKNVVANLNVDMIGRTDSIYDAKGLTDYVYIISSFGDSEDLIRFNEEVNETSTKLILDYRFSDPSDPNAFYRRSDHYNFVKKQIPILFYFNGTHNDYHKPSDTIDKINFTLLTKRAQLIFNTANKIAGSDIQFNRPGLKPRSK